ncbi:MAG: response regulator [Candidatus Omnitrophica bacterium]|nr:response regulator [Candidatus Omnitrophota bacterium]
MKKILIIDDEEDFCYFVKKNLEMTEYFEVAVCTDSAKAVQQVRQIRPDLILVDIMMPVIDGPSIVAELEESEDTKNIPFVFLTAMITNEETKKNKNIINDAYFVAKPVNVKELIYTINRLTQ